MTIDRVVVEVAHQLEFQREKDRRRLLREIGEEPDFEVALVRCSISVKTSLLLRQATYGAVSAEGVQNTMK